MNISEISEVALGAAIELDRLRRKEDCNLEPIVDLGNRLQETLEFFAEGNSESFLRDPDKSFLYSHALSKYAGHEIESEREFPSILDVLTKEITKISTDPQDMFAEENLAKMVDFCLVLHSEGSDEIPHDDEDEGVFWESN